MPMRKLKNYKPTRFMAETSHYSKKMADFAVMFIEQLTHTKGTWAGKPLRTDRLAGTNHPRPVRCPEAEWLPAVQYCLHRNSEEDGKVRTGRCCRPTPLLR